MIFEKLIVLIFFILIGWYLANRKTQPPNPRNKRTLYYMDYSTINPIFTILSFAVFGWFVATGNEKTQSVRLIDIFVYGPYLIFLGLQNMYVFTEFEKMFLLFLGTIITIYNARNYLYR